MILSPSDAQYNAGKKWLRSDNHLLPYLKDPLVILDVGANIGYTSIFFARNYPDAIVYAFEPVQENYSCLVENIKDYPNIVAHNFALGNSVGELTLSLPSSDDKNLGRMSVLGCGWKQETVPMESLDARDWGKVDFIKIDVESYELEVLKGGEALLNKYWPLIQLEINDGAHEYLSGMGYTYISRVRGDDIYAKSSA
jgi:FkbM family methyltransferase